MKFFKTNITTSSIIPFIENEQDFNFIRDHLLNKTTVTEHQIASRIAKTNDPNTTDTTDDPLVQIRLRQISKWVDNVIIHYQHEARLESFKKDIHQLWNQTFNETSIKNTKLIVGNRNSRNTTKALVHRRPHYKSLPKKTHQQHQNQNTISS
jgi:hypothetical protein